MKKPFNHKNHSKPKTRREFLAQGFIQLATTALTPGLLSHALSSTSAYGIQCPEVASEAPFPLLVFDCAGGASLSANWVVGKEGGPNDYLSSYDKMGVPRPPQSGEPIDTRFGVPMYSTLSQVFQGIISTTTNAAQANLRMGTICCASQDDSALNPFSPIFLAANAQINGNYFLGTVGTSNTLSGGKSTGPQSGPHLKSLRVSNVGSMLTALSYGPAIQNLSVDQKRAIAKASLNLSRSQKRKLAGMTLAQEFSVLADCGYVRNMDFTDTQSIAPAVDPRLNSDARAVYGISTNSTGTNTREATIAYNVLRGNTGPGTITIGGCDYHNDTQATGDAKDLQIGQSIGRAVELAKRLNRPLFFAVISDGSCYSEQGTRIWKGDSGSKGLAVMGLYYPAGPAPIRRLQLGHYQDGQGVDRNTYLGNDPEKVAYTIFANYLKVAGRLSSFESHVTNDKFKHTLLNQYLMY